jgi:hypothetical protein
MRPTAPDFVYVAIWVTDGTKPGGWITVHVDSDDAYERRRETARQMIQEDLDRQLEREEITEAEWFEVSELTDEQADTYWDSFQCRDEFCIQCVRVNYP